MSKELRAQQDEILGRQVMWEPDSKKNTQIDRFRAAVGAAFGLALGECARGPRAPGHPRRGPRDDLAEQPSSWGPGRLLFLGVSVSAPPCRLEWSPDVQCPSSGGWRSQWT